MLLGGLMMVGVVKGAAMIDVMRTWQATRLVENVEAAIGTYRDRYASLPGDDDRAAAVLGRQAARFWTGAGFISLAGNGVIDGLFFDRLSPQGEQYMAWRDLRLAGLWPGDGELIGLAAMPDNPFGGVMGFSQANLGLRHVLCLTAVPGAAAASIDAESDDGILSTGRIRARVRDVAPEVRSVYPTPGAGDYDVAETYMVCVRMRSLP